MESQAEGIDGLPHADAGLTEVENQLHDISRSGRDELTDVIGYQVGGRRRRVRPRLTLLCHRFAATGALTGREQAIQAATAMEMIHVGTLYHDDVVDQAPSRHGRGSVNQLWGNEMAILAGDYIILHAIELVARLGQEEACLAARTGRDMCRGMVTETAGRHRLDRSEESYFEVIGEKTAGLLSLCCELGAMQANADPETRAGLASFGWHFGMAYQLVDDVLDLTASSAQLGKPVGKDLVEGIFTLPVIRALQRDPALRQRLAAPLGNEAVDGVREMVIASGAVEETLAVAEQHLQDAAHAVERLGHLGQPAGLLVDFARETVMPEGELRLGDMPLRP
ncbi:polyprenyl synthetase family protein [Streptomyces sp. NBC_01283]|uniref:polyprenyl synthetase family protein n=1 Tax=Streptomyces sp. NBC_01283 TaxID=2903812 RepID=UPI00352E90C0|nr:polyprenyl synthetase family protein [Streptomyces sp. NBC_01283]